MSKITYNIEDYHGDEEIKSIHWPRPEIDDIDLELIVDRIGEDFYNSSADFEAFPINIKLWCNDEYLGRYRVDVEFEPRYFSRKVEDNELL